MSTRGDTLPEKLQEQIINKLVNRGANQMCADCHARGPRWISMDFGVFICLNCSGQHRNLGPHITRVRSVKLDKWTPEMAQIMDGLGNDVCNGYYEYNMPSNYPRPEPDSPDKDRVKEFIIQKYVKKRWAQEGEEDPYTQYQKLAKGEITQTATKPPAQAPQAPVQQPKPAPAPAASIDLLGEFAPAPQLKHMESDSKLAHQNHDGGDLITFDNAHEFQNVRRSSHRKNSLSTGNLIDSPVKTDGGHHEENKDNTSPPKKDAFGFLRKPAQQTNGQPAPVAAQPVQQQPLHQPLHQVNQLTAGMQQMTLQQQPVAQPVQQAAQPIGGTSLMDMYNQINPATLQQQVQQVQQPQQAVVASGDKKGVQRGDYRYLESFGAPQMGMGYQGGMPQQGMQNMGMQQNNMYYYGQQNPAMGQQAPGMYGNMQQQQAYYAQQQQMMGMGQQPGMMRPGQGAPVTMGGKPAGM